MAASTIELRLISRPFELYKVAWGNVVDLKLYEDMVLAKAEELMGDLQNLDKIDEAYDYLDLLLRHYPRTLRLAEVRNKFLFLDGYKAFRQKQYYHGLAIFLELYEKNRGYRFPGAPNTVASIIGLLYDKILVDFLNKEEYAGLRDMLRDIEQRYRGEQKAVTDKYWAKLNEMAEAQKAIALKSLDENKGRAAYESVAKMINILPTIREGRKIQREVIQRYPIVFVAVSEPATDNDPRSLERWSSRRVGRLTRRMLVEFVGQGVEGGLYKCPVGSVVLSDDGRELTFSLNAERNEGDIPPMDAYDISDRLLRLANPNSDSYLPAWARLVGSIRVDDPRTVVVELGHLHVLPEAFLQVDLSVQLEGQRKEDGPYVTKEKNPEILEVTFKPNPSYNLQSTIRRPEIVEMHFDDSQIAVDALRRGDIHVIDHVFPGDVERLRADPNIVVEPYDLPTLHALIPNKENKFTDTITFRRALVYGINRELIMKELLLAGIVDEECTLSSGPFPRLTPQNDAVAYAYDRRIETRAPERRLSATLAILAEKQLEAIAQKLEEDPPKRGSLVLAHPAGEVYRIACQAIQLHLGLNKIEIELKELPPGQTDDPKREYDLLYVELAIWEPLVDARRLLDTSSLPVEVGPYVNLALRRLDAATNWTEARRRLYELHNSVHNDLSVIPLWQMANYFAYRKSLQGVGSRPLTLYENIQQWQVIPE